MVWTITADSSATTIEGPGDNATAHEFAKTAKPFQLGINGSLTMAAALAGPVGPTSDGSNFWTPVWIGRLDEGLDGFRWLLGERSDELGPAPKQFDFEWRRDRPNSPSFPCQ